HELYRDLLEAEPLLVAKLIGNREVVTLQLRKADDVIDLSPYPGLRQKLQSIVDNILANNPSAVPIISIPHLTSIKEHGMITPLRGPTEYSLVNTFKYPSVWLRNILPYIRVPESVDNQEDVTHFINIPDNPYVDPIETMRFFIMEDTLYVKLNSATNYKRVYDELSKYVVKHVDKLYKQGAIAVSKGFAKQWGLEPLITPIPQNFPDKTVFTNDELSNIIDVNLELYPLAGVPDIFPKNPPDIEDIINYSIWTGGTGLRQTEAIGEPETQIGLDGSEALQNFSR